MRPAPYYEIAYPGFVQRAWIVLCLAACWSSTPAPTPTSARTAAPTASAPARLDGVYRERQSGPCGGAALPRDYKSPPLVPQPGVTIQIFSGATYDGGAPVAEPVTDAQGRFSASLPPGQYCVIHPHHGPKPTQGDTYTDLGCLVEQWHRCDLVVDVPAKTPVTLDYYEPCSWGGGPCYRGPAPP